MQLSLGQPLGNHERDRSRAGLNRNRVSFPAACGVNLYSRPKDAVMRSGQYPAPWGGEVYFNQRAVPAIQLSH